MNFIEGILVFLYLFICIGCASTPEEQAQAQGKPLIHPAAYAVDGFTWNKKMPQHERKNWEFYYKHCDMVGYNSYYSKTQYDCNDPY